MKIHEIESSLTKEIQSFPVYRKRWSYDSSPQQFEKKSGIKIAQDYKMPEGLTVEEIYRYLASVYRAEDSRKIKRAESRQRSKNVYDAILKLNPQLATIDNGTIVDAWGHILTAVLSRFPFDDIYSYVHDGKTGTYYYNRPDWPERYRKEKYIETVTGAPIHWVLSDKTLNYLLKKVKAKKKDWVDIEY